MALKQNTEIWREFFAAYRNLPELWDFRNVGFKDKRKKRIAWNKLLEKYKQIDRDANLENLKKKVLNLKLRYRRELKKKEGKNMLENNRDEEYIPNLWYFDDLDFLGDQESQTNILSSLDIKETDQVEDEAEDNFKEEFPFAKLLVKRNEKSENIMTEKNDVQDDPMKFTFCRKDDASIFAENWAVLYRKLSPIQQIYAKKSIEDILVLGQLGLLTLHSVKIPTEPLSITNPLSYPNSTRSSTPEVQESESSPSYEIMMTDS